MNSVTRTFAAIGIDTYESHPPLDYAVSEVQNVGLVLRNSGIFEESLLTEAAEPEVRNYLRDLARLNSQVLVALWAGHAEAVGGELLLKTRDDGGEIAATELFRSCAKSGASQILLVVDTCHSGAALGTAATVAATLLSHLPPDGERIWLGVLVSCSEVETARDGVFGRALYRLLTEGPRTEEYKRRWSPHNKMIWGDDLGQALLEEWEADQRPDFQRRGRSWDMFPNPLWRPDAHDFVIEHTTYESSAAAHAQPLFGRENEVTKVKNWIAKREPGIYVLSGSAGRGKTAILSEAIRSVNAEESPNGNTGAPRTAPALVNAKGATIESIARELDTILSENILPSIGYTRSVPDLISAIKATNRSGRSSIVLAVDGLDEARTETLSISTDLLVQVADHCTVVVATRQTTRRSSALLSEILQPSETVDLDDPACVLSEGRAIRSFVQSHLSGTSSMMDPGKIAEYFTNPDKAGPRDFLLARITVDQLKQVPVDTSLPGWTEKIYRTTGSAFKADLTNAALSEHRSQDVGRRERVAVAQAMLTSLSWALGSGFPEEEWIAICNQFNPTGTSVTQKDVTWILAILGRYIVESGTDGRAVYRLSNQYIAELVRPPHNPSEATPFEIGASEVWSALSSHYQRVIALQTSVDGLGYMWRFRYPHAAEAGPVALPAFRTLSDIEPRLTIELAHATQIIANVISEYGRPSYGLELMEDAMDIVQTLASNELQLSPVLAEVGGDLSIRYAAVSRYAESVSAGRRAITTLRACVEANVQFRSHLADALHNLAISLSRSGDVHEAVEAAEEAVALWITISPTEPSSKQRLVKVQLTLSDCLALSQNQQRALTFANAAVGLARISTNGALRHRQVLVDALVTLSQRLVEARDSDSAIGAGLEAVDICRADAGLGSSANHEYAGALENLATVFKAFGLHSEALSAAEEATQQWRRSPVSRADLSRSLSNLGNYRAEAGREADAVVACEESVSLCREMVRESPDSSSLLAICLTNLANSYGLIGRVPEAVRSVLEAIRIARPLAAGAVSKLELGVMLVSLGRWQSGLGHHQAAHDSTAEAVAILRSIPSRQQAIESELSRALNNLGLQCVNLSRRREAIEAAEESVNIWRSLVAVDDGFLPDLGVALNNLGGAYSECGELVRAVSTTRQSIEALTKASDAGYPLGFELANALQNLSARLGRAGLNPEAIQPAKESVRLYESLVSDNPETTTALANGLLNLAHLYDTIDMHDETIDCLKAALYNFKTIISDDFDSLLAIARVLDKLSAATGPSRNRNDEQSEWRETLGEYADTSLEAGLWIARAWVAPTGTAITARWLANAMPKVTRVHTPLFRACARRHHQAGREHWVRVWMSASGEPLPSWIYFDQAELDIAHGWTTTGTRDDALKWLEENGILLDHSRDTIVEEALMRVPVAIADRYASLRSIAQNIGVVEARSQFHAMDFIYELKSAEPWQLRNLLLRNREMCSEPLVRDLLAIQLSREEDQAATWERIGTLAELVAHASETKFWREVLDAIEFPTSLLNLCRDIASQDARRDWLLLVLIANYLASVLDDQQSRNWIYFYKAISAAASGDTDEARELLASINQPSTADQLERMRIAAQSGLYFLMDGL